MPVEIIEVEPKFRGWTTLSVAKVRHPDGQIVTRVIEDHGRAACVLPYDPDCRTALVVRQIRAPALHAGGPAMLIEAPAGQIDPGEDGVTAARREAMEETGVRLGALERVANLYTMPGISTEQMGLFLGTYSGADRIGPGGGVEGERIEVLELSLSALAAMADDGTLNDMKTFLLVQTLRMRRPELFGR
jgi:nudix-type nucleoside diphosphatase (YffH/AdpP family)